MAQPKAATEDEKMAGIQRLTNRYEPSESPVMVKGKEDYKRLRLSEVFQDIDTNRDGFLTFEELIQHLNKKGQQLRNDPKYQITLQEVEHIKILFDSADVDGSGSVNT